MSYRFLIVDDSRTVRTVVKKSVWLSGIAVGETHEAADGAEGVAAFENNEIDLVFADINMPVMNGIEMIEKIRSLTGGKDIPIAVVSTEGSVERLTRLRELGVKHMLRKPFTPEEIREVMQDLLGIAS